MCFKSIPQKQYCGTTLAIHEVALCPFPLSESEGKRLAIQTTNPNILWVNRLQQEPTQFSKEAICFSFHGWKNDSPPGLPLLQAASPLETRTCVSAGALTPETPSTTRDVSAGLALSGGGAGGGLHQGIRAAQMWSGLPAPPTSLLLLFCF